MPGLRRWSLACSGALAALVGAACSHDWQGLTELGPAGAGAGPGSGGAGNASQGGAGAASTGGLGGSGAQPVGGMGSGGSGIGGSGNGGSSNGGVGPIGGGGGATTSCFDTTDECEPCADDCALAGPCKDELDACQSHGGCSDILMCVSFACSSIGESDCVSFCMDSEPFNAQNLFEELVFCTHCGNCTTQCMGVINCNEWD